MAGFIFTADLHMQPSAWAGRPYLRGDSYFALGQLISLVAERQCPVVLGGDIFDSMRPDPESVSWLQRFVKAVEEQGQWVGFIMGNHDCTRPPWPQIAGARYLHKFSGEIGGVPVYCLDFTSRSMLPVALAEVPADRVFICHQAWKQLQGGSHWDGDLDDCPAFMTLSGDLHITKQWGSTAKSAYSPGSTCMQSIDEEEQKSVFFVAPTSGPERVLVERVPIASRLVRRFKVGSPAELDTLCLELRELPFGEADMALFPDYMRKPIAAVEYLPELQQIVPRLELAVGDRWHLFLRPKPRQTGNMVIEMPAQRPSASTMDLFAEAARETSPADVDALLELLRSASAGRPQCESWVKADREKFLAEFNAAQVTV